ncbi:hypothetical protein PoB_002527100 [Plakobranchus ocellatus]|uniref:Uncharacterized protein n=1 Tax=Plakobranchus ocellatus TaxID=259542 RepID=A0AAV3ZI05_9GAST|nr:hypothetical protein PoB_002527100 [Plakobranchus ocellatus]
MPRAFDVLGDHSIYSHSALTPADQSIHSHSALTPPGGQSIYSHSALTPADQSIHSNSALTPPDEVLIATVSWHLQVSDQSIYRHFALTLNMTKVFVSTLL